MFKIDWPCALGGAVAGYFVKGKVSDVKTKFQGIYTQITNDLKETFSNDPQQPSAPGGAPTGQGQGTNP